MGSLFSGGWNKVLGLASNSNFLMVGKQSCSVFASISGETKSKKSESP